MSLIPAFDVDVWNAWILIAPYLLVNFVLPLFAVGRKSTFWVFPSYTKLEKVYLITQQVLMGFLLIFSIFLPLNIGTAWFFVGLPVYLFGLIFVTNAMLTFILNPVDKPNTTGLYHISRHPMYLGILLVHIGIGIATASWVYLLLALLYLGTYRNVFILPEERFCCEKFGDAYREYMNRTPRWIGLPKY